MSRRLNKSSSSKVEKERKDEEAKKQSIWLQTGAGEIVECEYKLGRQSPLICEKLKFEVGSTRSSPISLDPEVSTKTLEMIFDYLRFYQEPGHTDKEYKLFVDGFLKKDTRTLSLLVRAAEFLRLEKLVDVICRALARHIENGSPELKQEFAALCKKRGQENPFGDLRNRLTNKLLAKQKKEPEDVKNKAETKVEVSNHEDRPIDDLIAFINGSDGDSKGVQTSKKKKKNRNTGKVKNKTSSSGALSSIEASASRKVVENSEQDINAYTSANHGGSAAESLNVEGGNVDDVLDPVLLEKNDREVEYFIRSVGLDPAQIY